MIHVFHPGPTFRNRLLKNNISLTKMIRESKKSFQEERWKNVEKYLFLLLTHVLTLIFELFSNK